MDDFNLQNPELTGSFISLNFGSGGRVHELWVSDPSLPIEGDEYQFVLPMIRFGEEFAEDCYPGTILIGARTSPEDPWILSRNTEAQLISDPDNPRRVSFEYEFSLLPEINAVGHFYETGTDVAQIVWDVTVSNQGRQAIEIGELGFPFAFNNFISSSTPVGTGKLVWDDRVHIHKYIGGAASYLYVQRMNAEPPGLLVFPGDETGWEFYASVRASINTPFQWEGIPIIYVLSRATIEREGWPNWFNQHTSVILGPGESRTFQTRFAPAFRGRYDGVSQVLNACGKPAIRLLPGAVVPREVPLAVEVAGATPVRFYTSRRADIEADSDEEGGFCLVQAKVSGPLRVSFEDTKGRLSHTHLFITAPIRDLIEARAKWIVDNQICEAPNTSLDQAIVPVDIRTGEPLAGPEYFGDPFFVESGLADLMFLAEKNTLYPDRRQIKAIEKVLTEFVLDDLQNPHSFAVGSAFPDDASVAVNVARPLPYMYLMNTYRAMHHVARDYGNTSLSAETYLACAYRTALAMAENTLVRSSNKSVAGLTQALHDLIRALHAADCSNEADRLIQFLRFRSDMVLRRRFPVGETSTWDASEFFEYISAALLSNSEDLVEKAVQVAYAGRSLAPSYWWCGVDKHQPFASGEIPHPAFVDKGEFCNPLVTSLNSTVYFKLLERDLEVLPEAYIRQAFSGAMVCWTCVRADGAASMGFCPDSSSKMAGFSPVTGNIGHALYNYLRNAGSYVVPSRHYGTFVLGCHYEYESGVYRVKPWEGVGRSITLQHTGVKINLSFGRIKEIIVSSRKHLLSMTIENPADKAMRATASVSGLWGGKVDSDGQIYEAENGTFSIPVKIPKRSSTTIFLKVIE